MLFSETAMQEFQTLQLIPKPGKVPQPYFQLKGNIDTIMHKLGILYSDNSRPARAAKNHRTPSEVSGWCGFGEQTLANAIETRNITRAVEEFQKAKARIDAQLTRGAVSYSPVGASFSVGRFLSGHPVSAFKREKTKFPPKTINLSIKCSAGLAPSALSAPLVKIVRAAWEYQAAGGIVSLTVNYFHTFDEPQDWNGIPHRGLITSITIPLSNPGILASAASVQFYRGISMPIAVYLSGLWGDGLPLETWQGNGVYPLTGASGEDAAVLKALRIEG